MAATYLGAEPPVEKITADVREMGDIHCVEILSQTIIWLLTPRFRGNEWSAELHLGVAALKVGRLHILKEPLRHIVETMHHAFGVITKCEIRLKALFLMMIGRNAFCILSKPWKSAVFLLGLTK